MIEKYSVRNNLGNHYEIRSPMATELETSHFSWISKLVFFLPSR